jgi:hypothetical protein
MDPVKVEDKRPQEWLSRHKSDSRWNLSQLIDPPCVVLVLDTDADPNISRLRKIRSHPYQTTGPLGEQLVRVLRRVDHHLEDPMDEVGGDPRMP